MFSKLVDYSMSNYNSMSINVYFSLTILWCFAINKCTYLYNNIWVFINFAGVFQELIFVQGANVTLEWYAHRVLLPLLVLEVSVQRTDDTPHPLQISLNVSQWGTSRDLSFSSVSALSHNNNIRWYGQFVVKVKLFQFFNNIFRHYQLFLFIFIIPRIVQLWTLYVEADISVSVLNYYGRSTYSM